jgi:hypothetical protein
MIMVYIEPPSGGRAILAVGVSAQPLLVGQHTIVIVRGYAILVLELGGAYLLRIATIPAAHQRPMRVSVVGVPDFIPSKYGVSVSSVVIPGTLGAALIAGVRLTVPSAPITMELTWRLIVSTFAAYLQGERPT